MKDEQFDALVGLICGLIGEAETYSGEQLCAPETWRSRVACIIKQYRDALVTEDDDGDQS